MLLSRLTVFAGKYLSGVGISRQRQAIVEGLRESVLEFAEAVEGATPKVHPFLS